LTDRYFIVSLGYILLTLVVGVFEGRRIRASGPDTITIFIVLCVVQCCLPGIVIYACLPLVDPTSLTGVAAFDNMLAASDVTTAFLVLGLTAWFVLFFYGFAALSGRLLRRLSGGRPDGSLSVAAGSPPRLMILLTLGLALSLASFYVLGGSLTERYVNLIFFRAGSQEGEENLVNAYGFALTQTWAWLSVLALFVIFERRGRRLGWFLCLAFLCVFVLLGVSRRALFIPLLLAYLSLVLFDHRWRLTWLSAAAIPILAWVAFGKEIIGSVAFGGSWSDVIGRYETIPESALRAASEIGLTILESLGSINLLDLPPRFGVDHLLSVLRQIPTSHLWLGALPPRMVRLSTAAFASASAEDIPPGLFGQMWMDFRIFGPVVWGLFLGVQMSLVQLAFARTIRTRQTTALFVLLTFIVALPLPTGTYDFTFSIDIYVLVLCLFLTFRFIRVLPPTSAPGIAGAAYR